MNKKIIVALAVCFGILYAIGIAWGMPSEFVSEIDSEFPSGPFNIIAHLRDNSYATPYPVFHRLFMLPLYAFVLFGLKITGQCSSFSSTWPYGFNNPAAAMTLLITTARLVSLLMGAGTICILGLMVNRIAGNTNPKYRMLIFSPVFAFGLSGVVAYYSRTSTYDVPQLFWWSLSFFFLWKYLFEPTLKKSDLVFSALFAALTTATKDQMVFFVASSSLLLLFFPLSTKNFQSKLKCFIMYSMYSIVFYCVAAVLIQPYHWISHMKMVLFLNITSGRFAVYSNAISGQINLFIECTKCLSHIMTPCGVVLSIISIPILIIKRKFNVLIAIGTPVILTYIFVFARIHFVFERYMLNYAFLFTIASALGIRCVIDTISPAKLKYFWQPALYIIVGCWLLHQIVFSFLPLTFAQYHDTKKQLSRILPAIVPAGDTIGWQGTRFSFPNATTYTRYHFAVPDTVYSSFSSSRIANAFVRSNANQAYVLSDRDLFCRDKNLIAITRKNWVDTVGLKLIAKIQDPEFIQNHIQVYSAAHRVLTFRVSIPYYLYKRM